MSDSPADAPGSSGPHAADAGAGALNTDPSSKNTSMELPIREKDGGTSRLRPRRKRKARKPDEQPAVKKLRPQPLKPTSKEAQDNHDGWRRTKVSKAMNAVNRREKVLRAEKRWTSFRFMDLPPELRLRVYHHYFEAYDLESLEAVRLFWTVLPDICETNQMIRRESTPVFFNSTEFTIGVGADFDLRGAQRFGRVVPDFHRHFAVRNAGHLLLSRRVRRIMRNIDPPTVFRHITFDLYNARTSPSTRGDIETLWGLQLEGPEYRSPYEGVDNNKVIRDSMKEAAATLKIECKSGRLVDHITPGPFYTHVGYVPSGYPYEAEDVDAAIAPALEVASSLLASRAVPNGWTLADLEAIAAAFRSGL